MARYMSWIKVFSTAITESLAPLSMITFVMSLAVIMVSSIVFFAEKKCPSDDDGCVDDFESIPATFYWCIITMTTVGYGEVFPKTSIGKVVACMAFLCGILLLAVPISVISANFQSAYQKMISQRIIKRAQQMKLKQAKEEALERATLHERRRNVGVNATESADCIIMLRLRKEAVANAEKCAYLESIFLATKMNQKNMLGQMKEREVENRFLFTKSFSDVCEDYIGTANQLHATPSQMIRCL